MGLKATIEKKFDVTVETKCRKEGSSIEIYASVYPGRFKSVAARRAAKVGTLMGTPALFDTMSHGPSVGIHGGGKPELMERLLRSINNKLEASKRS